MALLKSMTFKFEAFRRGKDITSCVNHLTRTRHVYTYLNALVMQIPNKVMNKTNKYVINFVTLLFDDIKPELIHFVTY